jgi:serine/threonine protein kinase
MGIVWEAYDEFLHRPVAVKEVLLPPGIPPAEADDLRERTLREARAIAVLSHPNVVTLHDVARENDEPFVVTEYLAAYNLVQLTRSLGPLDDARAAAIGEAVAAGLGAAHQAGITHRDVKPGNVLVGRHGHVKLTDFGIAHNVSEHTMTKTGIMLGSPSYISPEVAAGQPVTPAADLWGLGATLFAMVEGRPPYESGSVLDIVNKVVHGEIPKPATEGPIGEVIAGLMVKDPTKRMSLTEVRNRLHPLVPPPSTPLLSYEDLELLAAEPTDVNEPVRPPEPPPVQAVAPEPDAAPSELAPAPGPLPFDVTVRHRGPRRRRSASSRALIAVLSVLFFVGAAGGGFALARVVAGESIRPPEQTSTPTPPKITDPPLEELAPVTGDAATSYGMQGGEFTLSVPPGWVQFIEVRLSDDLPEGSKFYYVSPNGTQVVTVERLPGFYPDHVLEDYLKELASAVPAVSFEQVDSVGIRGATGAEAAQQLTYRTRTNAELLTPDDPSAPTQNRVTFANLLPQMYDLWVVSVTVPIEQEDSGRADLFDKIAPTFKLLG